MSLGEAVTPEGNLREKIISPSVDSFPIVAHLKPSILEVISRPTMDGNSTSIESVVLNPFIFVKLTLENFEFVVVIRIDSPKTPPSNETLIVSIISFGNSIFDKSIYAVRLVPVTKSVLVDIYVIASSGLIFKRFSISFLSKIPIPLIFAVRPFEPVILLNPISKHEPSPKVTESNSSSQSSNVKGIF